MTMKTRPFGRFRLPMPAAGIAVPKTAGDARRLAEQKNAEARRAREAQAKRRTEREAKIARDASEARRGADEAKARRGSLPPKQGARKPAPPRARRGPASAVAPPVKAKKGAKVDIQALYRTRNREHFAAKDAPEAPLHGMKRDETDEERYR